MDEPEHPVLLIACLTAGDQVSAMGAAARRQGIPWLAWNLTDDPAITVEAYEAGARAVLPARLTRSALQRMVDDSSERRVRSAVGETPAAALLEPGTVRYGRGQQIPLPADAVLEVRDGVVAAMAAHANGAEVLLGFCGAHQILLGTGGAHALVPIAHTDAKVAVVPWSKAAQQPDFPERLRERLHQLEQWAAMQGHGQLDQRLRGILWLLAQQFGVPHNRGIMIDLRITHDQLAAAIGGTRTTVTRLLGVLRRRGLLSSVGSGATERLLLAGIGPPLL
jgi:Crp-like helix-turn-helix domain